jgi:hypothetical protein
MSNPLKGSMLLRAAMNSFYQAVFGLFAAVFP